MKQETKVLYILFLCGLSFTAMHGQSSVSATGVTAAGTGGTATYTVGQVVYTAKTGSTGSVTEGVQQPFEISVLTAVKNTDGITLDYIVYPNPTSGSLKLLTGSIEDQDLRYRLYDLGGVLLQEKKIINEETGISLDNYSSAVYFLKVLKGNTELKAFKIIKR